MPTTYAGNQAIPYPPPQRKVTLCPVEYLRHRGENTARMRSHLRIAIQPRIQPMRCAMNKSMTIILTSAHRLRYMIVATLSSRRSRLLDSFQSRARRNSHRARKSRVERRMSAPPPLASITGSKGTVDIRSIVKFSLEITKGDVA